MDSFNRLGRDFYNRPAIQVARELLGMRLVRIEDGRRTAGLILEAEAYGPEEDLGCHCRYGRTQRTGVMYGPPGYAYVYFTYGMHWMLNAVTGAEGYPAAVLIRAILPEEGIERMIERRTKTRLDKRQRRPGYHPLLERSDLQPSNLNQLADGPAKLCQALGITGELNGVDLCSQAAVLFVEKGQDIPDLGVTIGPRVGLNTVPEPWKSMPWRFRVEKDLLGDKR